MSALACCAFCRQVVDEARARRFLVELRHKSYVVLYCDQVCENADQSALDFRVAYAVGDALLGGG